MKLKCDAHDRRVLTVPNSPSFLHRTGDMSKCDSKTASLTDRVSHIKRTFRIMRHLSIPNLFALGPAGVDKQSGPHNNDPDGINLKRYTRPQE